jgi:hypothetical protein
MTFFPWVKIVQVHWWCEVQSLELREYTDDARCSHWNEGSKQSEGMVRVGIQWGNNSDSEMTYSSRNGWNQNLNSESQSFRTKTQFIF